jgi:signal transduction histidine kinase
MKKACAILLVGFMALFSSKAQNKAIDSLKSILDSNIPDSTKAYALATISYFYLEQNLDSCLFYSKRLYQISSSSKSINIQFLGLERMGGVLWRRGDAKNSVDFLLEALQIAQLTRDSARISIIYFDLGNAYRSESDYKTAESYYLKSLKYPISNGLKGRLLMYMGEIYLEKGNPAVASSYAKESYRIVKSHDQRTEYNYLSSALKLQFVNSVNRYLPSTLNLLGKISMKLGDTSVAYEYFKMGITEGYANNNMSALTDNNLSIARIFRLRRNLDSAYSYGSVAYENAKKLNSHYKIEEITSFLKDLFAEHKKIDSAFKYQSIMIAAKDSILNIEKALQIQNLSFAEQQRQQDLKKSKVEFQNKIEMYAAVAGMLGLVLVAAILYRNNQQRQKAFILLQKQKQETETQKIKTEQALDELKLVNKEIENKNRELEIESALERVRAKAMAMHNSEDLSTVAATLFDELLKLGVETIRCGIGIATNESGIWHTWTAVPSKEGYTINISGKIDLNFHPVMQGALRAFQQHQLFFSRNISGNEIKDYYRHLEALPDYHIPTGSLYLSEQTYSGYFFEDGAIFTFTKAPPNEWIKQILTKFVAVFSLAYRRYKDLRLAEEQAREAQIEASLERVRSKTMAMHSSEDVTAATESMFDEFKRLGINNLRCGVSDIHPTNRTFDVFGGGITNLTAGNTIRGFSLFGIDEHPVWQRWFDSWKKKEVFFVVHLAGQEKEDYYNYINNNHPNYLSQHLIQLPDHFFQAYHFDQGSVWVVSLLQHTPQEREVMKRFASGFSLTFRRYQDLKKAEYQAQEATIEAAIEKVRGKAMAMHTTQDLSSAAATVFAELRKLGITPYRCGVGIIDNEGRRIQAYTSTAYEGEESFALTGWIELTGHPVLEKLYENWKNKQDYFPVLAGEEIQSFYNQLSAGISVPYIPDWKSGKKQFGYLLSLTVCVMYSWTDYALTESEINILKRFAAVIDLTFRRYHELQQSEINAREAMRQASLDRVRAEIASMRTTNDLDKIIPLIWAELLKLGIHFVRCGVFIMDEKKELMHAFLSTPAGQAIASVDIPFDKSRKLGKSVKLWRQNKPYIEHWQGDDFEFFIDILLARGAIKSREEYHSQIPREGLFIHCMPFLQGMLYVGNTTRLEEDEINLIQSLADAFSTAYSRYEDFSKLESAKIQVEKSLTDLKSTQALLIQSEKMASLGEITAGIAHEIQNPLNFINNFAQVNEEFIDEAEDAINKGKTDEAKHILHNLKDNQKKINQHGQRADSIVKGMLQHSRSSIGQKEPTDINALADEYLRLAYHGLRAKDKSFNATMKTDYDGSNGRINLIPQDIARMLLNLYNNAFYAVNEKMKSGIANYEPTVSITTRSIKPTAGGQGVEIKVTDNGSGIPQKIVDKIFQPFFTTKPAGQGTGLGLSMSYDIIKAHGGIIKVESKEGIGSEFIVELPT